MKGITKGEWKITEKLPNGIEQLAGHIEIANNEWNIACVFTDIESIDEAKANAQLICTAGNLTNAGYNIEAMPQLVEALKLAHSTLKETHPLFNEWAENTVIEEAIKSAKI